MTSLLVIIVLVLLAVAIWQLTKIFDLTQIGGLSDNSQVANDRDNNINGYMMFAFLGFIYVTTIYCIIEFGHFPLMSNSASEHGQDVDNLMWISMILIFIVQFITQALLHYFAFKYRGKQGKKALYFADNDKLEFIWTIIPVIVLAGLILYGLYAWTNIMFVDEDEDVIVVELYAKQFSWEARYSGEDNVLGKANVRYIEGVNTLGVDVSDPNAQDDKVVNELHLPKGKKILFKMRSQDVLHSAYMPHFRAQMNCVPGMVTQFAFTPNKTTVEMRQHPDIVEKVAHINELRAKKSIDLVKKGEPGLDPYNFDFLLLCNKICGPSHYNMQMKIVVESEADFKKWLSDKPTLVSAVKAEKEPKPETVGPTAPLDTTKAAADTTKVVAAN
ncbi:cytochrome c oxidase subunit II [Flavobacterium sp. WW92]|uniref:cytochrome c oxidase subunit II n=1 Tax=unclassified Flavobacterium TaxID=196869 RepID=UPI0022259440|nr:MULTISPECIES: cytochrome c oxidase subunit II [unclassified Flavobacterium]WDO13398.1 cytochrome c oxidase subunit II [Flavobacterium sp. WW92]